MIRLEVIGFEFGFGFLGFVFIVTWKILGVWDFLYLDL